MASLLLVTLKRETIQLFGCAALLLLAAGCSGINATKSVSPIDFLIPGGGGLMRHLIYVPPAAPPALPAPAAPLVPAPAIPKQLALGC